MPYCPKCDMEFIDGITVCTDCGGPLVESEEVAKAMKKKERELAMERERAMMEELYKSVNGATEEADDDFGETGNAGARENSSAGIGENTSAGAEEGGSAKASKSASMPDFEPVKVYVDKAQKYDDLKSSASAFLAVGAVLAIAAVLFWTGIVNLPMVGLSKIIFQTAITAMAVFSLVVYIKSNKSAKEMAPEIDKEKQQTKELVDWFLDKYSAAAIDKEIASSKGSEDLTEEELSLKRFQLIQDYLITGKDLPDPAYVDALSEEIYSKLYES